MFGIGLLILAAVWLVCLFFAVVCFVGAIIAIVTLRPLITIALFAATLLFLVLAVLTGGAWLLLTGRLY